MRDLAECIICEATEDLGCVPIMTGDDFRDPKWPVCGDCVRAWYESGETTWDGILRYRGLPASPDPKTTLLVL